MRLFRVEGIPVDIQWTWLFVFVLVVWSLATNLFPATYPGLSGPTYLLMALVATASFFGSILVHELSHTLRSLREGLRVREIMLDRTDDVRSRTVAATGTIDADGSVGAVGGVHEKAIAAREAGAHVFVLPAEELSAVDRDRLDVRGVEDLSRAVLLLQAA